MNIEFHSSFKKAYKKRTVSNAQLTSRCHERLQFFRNNPKHPLLKDHALIGKHKFKRAFSISGDIRVIYTLLDSDTALFLDIGSHNQVY